jgi:hypothetical protein
MHKSQGLIKVQNTLAVLLLAIVMLPGLASAEESKSVHKITAFDTVAGRNAAILISGVPNEIITIKSIDPHNTAVESKSKLSSSGSIVYNLKSLTKAGIHTILAGGRAASFTVSPAVPIITSTPSESVFRQSETLSVSVNAQDKFRNPIPNLELSLQSKENTQTTSCKPANCQTDKKGNLEFMVRFNSTGFQEITISNGTQIYATNEVGVLPARKGSKSGAKNTFFSSIMAGILESEGEYLEILEDDYRLLGEGNSDTQLSDIQVHEFLMAQSLGSPDIKPLPLITPSAATTTGTPASTAAPVTTQAATTQEPAATTQSLLAAKAPGLIDHFNITIDGTVYAGLVPTVTVTAVDVNDETVVGYNKTINASISPSAGTSVPGDFTFIPEQHEGTQNFEVSYLVQKAGTYKLKVVDTEDESIFGELEFEVISLSENASTSGPSLTITSPIGQEKYAGTFSVAGSTDRANAEVTVSHNGQQLATAAVEEDKSFDLPVKMGGDGEKKIVVAIHHIPTDTTTTEEMTVYIDTVAPVITSVSVNPQEVIAGDNITVVLLSEPNITARLHLNNETKDFPASTNNSYSLTLPSPAVAGTYTMNVTVTDALGNTDSVQNVANVEVKPALPNVENLLGIPGIESVRLKWDLVPEAIGYQVTFFHQGLQQTFTTQTNSYLAENLDSSSSYEFQVLALGADGKHISNPAQTIPLTPQPAPVASIPQAPAHPAANIHTASGPEVYVFIAISILFLNLYSRIRKGFM